MKSAICYVFNKDRGSTDDSEDEETQDVLISVGRIQIKLDYKKLDADLHRWCRIYAASEICNLKPELYLMTITCITLSSNCAHTNLVWAHAK